MLRVAIPPCDQQTVYNVRTRWVAEYLSRIGEIELVHTEEELSVRFANRQHGTPEPVGIRNLPDADVIVFTRLLAGRIVDAIPMMQRAGLKVVVDIDDDFRHISPYLAKRDSIDPVKSKLYNWRHFARACTLADMVTCSTDALKRYATHGRVAVLRNCVPERYLAISAKRTGKTVGWGGAAATHPGDLDVTHGGIGQVVREMGADFMVVGPPDDVQRLLSLPERPWATGMVEHYIYPMKVAEFDVGLAPLHDSAFNRSKSHLKPLEYLALGVPCVASTTPEYLRFAQECEATVGSPLPMTTAGPRSREWRRQVRAALSHSQDDRVQRIAAGREFVRQRYTVEGQAWRWAETWARALEREP